jgi:hypothetical protein
MSFGLAFTYIFKDPDWFKKMITAGLFLLIPILGQLVVLGWALRITRRVIDQDPETLPNVDFGSDLGRGFSAILIGLVYAMPVILLSGVLGVLDAVISNLSSSEAVMYGIAFITVCAGLFTLVYGLLMAVLLPAAYGNFAAKGTLSAAFNVGQVLRLVRSALGAYAIVVLGMIVVGFIAPLGSLACVIGVIVTMVYAQAVLGHFYGQAYKEAVTSAAFGR